MLQSAPSALEAMESVTTVDIVTGTGATGVSWRHVEIRTEALAVRLMTVHSRGSVLKDSSNVLLLRSDLYVLTNGCACPHGMSQRSDISNQTLWLNSESY